MALSPCGTPLIARLCGRQRRYRLDDIRLCVSQGRDKVSVVQLHMPEIVAQSRAVAVSSPRRHVRVRTAMEAHRSFRSVEQVELRALRSCMRFVDVLRHEVSRTMKGSNTRYFVFRQHAKRCSKGRAAILSSFDSHSFARQGSDIAAFVFRQQTDRPMRQGILLCVLQHRDERPAFGDSGWCVAMTQQKSSPLARQAHTRPLGQPSCRRASGCATSTSAHGRHRADRTAGAVQSNLRRWTFHVSYRKGLEDRARLHSAVAANAMIARWKRNMLDIVFRQQPLRFSRPSIRRCVLMTNVTSLGWDRTFVGASFDSDRFVRFGKASTSSSFDRVGIASHVETVSARFRIADASSCPVTTIRLPDGLCRKKRLNGARQTEKRSEEHASCRRAGVAQHDKRTFVHIALRAILLFTSDLGIGQVCILLEFRL